MIGKAEETGMMMLKLGEKFINLDHLLAVSKKERMVLTSRGSYLDLSEQELDALTSFLERTCEFRVEVKRTCEPRAEVPHDGA